MRKYLLTLLLLHLAFFMMAQNRIITGMITDVQKQPLAGVTVLANNQRSNAVTGIDGHFSITVPQGRTTMEISFVGYKN